MIKKTFAFIVAALLAISDTHSQNIVYSEPERQDDRDISFDIIGKLNGNILVYKNVRWKHAISIYDKDMQLKERTELDFMPEKTVNVDFVVYPDFIYAIYQHQKRNIVYCMGVKLNADGQKMAEPVVLDTTRIDVSANSKIYSTINSEDKQKIMIFKLYKKQGNFHFVTLLFDQLLQLQRKSREVTPFDERRDSYTDFFVDNEGNFVYGKSTAPGVRDYVNQLQLAIKTPTSDTTLFYEVDLDKRYIDDVKLKVDNVNKRLLINAFYYKQKRGNIEGLFTCVWDKVAHQTLHNNFTALNDTLRRSAKSDGADKFAFNDFFIRNIIVKKDGGFLLMAEDFSTQSRGGLSPWNRWDYLNSGFYSPFDYYMYSPSYNWFYRPIGSFNNQQSTRYYYSNVLVLSVDKDGVINWSNLIRKDQFEDDNDNYLSYGALVASGEIQFFFNDQDKRNQLVAWQSMQADGSVRRNPPFKSMERGYQFMPRFVKQTGGRQVVMPCSYRGRICFARIDF